MVGVNYFFNNITIRGKNKHKIIKSIKRVSNERPNDSINYLEIL